MDRFALDHDYGDKSCNYADCAIRGGAKPLTLNDGYVFPAFTKYFTVPEGATDAAQQDLSFEEAASLVELSSPDGCMVMYKNADGYVCFDSLQDMCFDDINSESVMALFSEDECPDLSICDPEWVEHFNTDELPEGFEPQPLYMYEYDIGSFEDGLKGRLEHATHVALVPEENLDDFIVDQLGAADTEDVYCGTIEPPMPDYDYITDPEYI